MNSPLVLKENLKMIRFKLKKIGIKTNKQPSDITIVAVTKEFPQKTWDLALENNIFSLLMFMMYISIAFNF